MKRYMRSSKDVILGGVAGGFSEYLDLDVTLIRVVFVILGFISLGLAILVYIVIWAVAPLNKSIKAPVTKVKKETKKKTPIKKKANIKKK